MEMRCRGWLLHWQREIRPAVLPGLAVASTLLFLPGDLPAQTGWKWGSRRPEQAESAVAKSAPQNGFATAIRKLQTDAKQRAFDGDIDGAIASAQRARKIAEASAALVSDDAECSVEAADQLVKKLMALKPSTFSPEVAASSRTEVLNHFAGHDPQPVTPVRTIAPQPTRPRVAFNERPLPVFTPHLMAAQIEPPPVVAGGWLFVSEFDTMLAGDAPSESFDEGTAIQASATEAEPEFVLPRQTAADLGRFDRFGVVTSAIDAGEPGVESETTRDDAPAWEQSTPAITPAVGVESPPRSDAQDNQPQLLHSQEPQGEQPPPNVPIERTPKRQSSDHIQPLESDMQPYRRPADANRSGAHFTPAAEQSNAIVTAHVNASTAQWRALEEREPASTNLAAATVTPTGYLTSQPLTSFPDEQSILEVPVANATAWFRDVEPLDVSTATPAEPFPPSSLQMVEQLAAWTGCPAQRVAATLAGLGFILLGAGLCLTRFAWRRTF